MKHLARPTLQFKNKSKNTLSCRDFFLCCVCCCCLFAEMILCVIIIEMSSGTKIFRSERSKEKEKQKTVYNIEMYILTHKKRKHCVITFVTAAAADAIDAGFDCWLQNRRKVKYLFLC